MSHWPWWSVRKLRLRAEGVVMRYRMLCILPVLVLLLDSLPALAVNLPEADFETGTYAEHLFTDEMPVYTWDPDTAIKYGYFDDIPSENVGTACPQSYRCDIPIINRCGTTVLNVIAFKYENGYFISSDVVTYQYFLEQVPPAEPIFEPVAFTFEKNDPNFTVLMGYDDNSSLRYSTDGNDPYFMGNQWLDDVNSIDVNGAWYVFNTDKTRTIRMISCRDVCPADAGCSDEVVVTYTCQRWTMPPVISPDDTSPFEGPIQVTISVMSQQTLKYTLDGSNPLTNGIDGGQGVSLQISENTIVKAVAIENDEDCVAIPSFAYRDYEFLEYYIPEPPEVDLQTGFYNYFDYSETDPLTVNILWTQEFAYTTDNTEPICEYFPFRPVPDNPLSIEFPHECGPKYLKVKTCDYAFTPPLESGVATYVYNLIVPAPTPIERSTGQSLECPPGEYGFGFDLLFDSGVTSASDFYWTVDGSEPGVSDTTIRGYHVPIRENVVVKAVFRIPDPDDMAVCGEFSAVFEGEYLVTEFSWRRVTDFLLFDGTDMRYLDLATDVGSGLIAASYVNGVSNQVMLLVADLFNDEMNFYDNGFYAQGDGYKKLFVANGIPYLLHYRSSNDTINIKEFVNGSWRNFNDGSSTIVQENVQAVFVGNIYSYDGDLRIALFYKDKTTGNAYLTLYSADRGTWVSSTSFGSGLGIRGIATQFTEGTEERTFLSYSQNLVLGDGTTGSVCRVSYLERVNGVFVKVDLPDTYSVINQNYNNRCEIALSQVTENLPTVYVASQRYKFVDSLLVDYTQRLDIYRRNLADTMPVWESLYFRNINNHYQDDYFLDLRIRVDAGSMIYYSYVSPGGTDYSPQMKSYVYNEVAGVFSQPLELFFNYGMAQSPYYRPCTGCVGYPTPFEENMTDFELFGDIPIALYVDEMEESIYTHHFMTWRAFLPGDE